jgi:2,4-dienoyl-CoA reductase-like NADH-dependent reductase (Old Yellow Enzyme family)
MLELAEIDAIVERFAYAAALAVRAGFDGKVLSAVISRMLK